MKSQFLLKVWVVCVGALLCRCGGARAPQNTGGTKAVEDYHIGVMTGPGSHSSHDVVAAKRACAMYGAVGDDHRGCILHVTYPEDFVNRQDETVSRLLAFADDPLMGAIVVSEGIHGTAEAFNKIRAKRSDIMLFVGDPHEYPELIQKSADIVVSDDYAFGGYAIPWAAKKMGARTLVHVSFPRHLSKAELRTRRQVMEAVCADIGIEFASEEAPDPAGESGVEGARAFIGTNTKQWIGKYGKNTMFFCTNDTHRVSLMRELVSKDGMLLGANVFDCAEALGVEYADDEDVSGILERVESAVEEKRLVGRFGVNVSSHIFVSTLGLTEYARRILQNELREKDMRVALSDAFSLFSKGTRWRVAPYTDLLTGKEVSNHVSVFSDIHILGKFSLPVTDQEFPEKYRSIRFGRQ